MGPVTREQVALLTQRHRLADVAVSALATRHSLEVYTALYAAVWGLMTMIYPEYLTHAHTKGLYDLVSPHPWALGLLPFVLGCLGLYALKIRDRVLRSRTAMVSALLWWMLAGWYLWGVTPAVTSAVIAYGGAAVAEAWVYVRVAYHFDDLTRVVTRHDRHPPRGA